MFLTVGLVMQFLQHDPTLFRRITKAFRCTWAGIVMAHCIGGTMTLLSNSSKAADAVSVLVSDQCQHLLKISIRLSSAPATFAFPRFHWPVLRKLRSW